MSFHLREWLQRLQGTFKRRDSETDEEQRQEGEPFQWTAPGAARVNGAMRASNVSPERVRIV